MRDDLHKTVSLPRRWTAIVRRMSKDRWTPTELAPLIVEAVLAELTPKDSAEWRRLDDAISRSSADLLDDGSDAMRLSLYQIHDSPLSVGVRTVCETALGVLGHDGLSPLYRKQVLQTAGADNARDHIEQAVSQVLAKRGGEQARQVFAKLSEALRQCDFSIRPSMVNRKAEGSIEAGLSTELIVNV
jgi:hypothetical protein